MHPVMFFFPRIAFLMHNFLFSKKTLPCTHHGSNRNELYSKRIFREEDIFLMLENHIFSFLLKNEEGEGKRPENSNVTF